jgi:hypothetical protein
MLRTYAALASRPADKLDTGALKDIGAGIAALSGRIGHAYFR